MKSNPLEDWFGSTLRRIGGEVRSDSTVLSLLTVVIPCYDRQDFLLRQCVYWHRRGASVVIVDGSPRSLSDSVQQTISSLGDVTYLHAEVSMMDRLKLACEYLQTPYTILLGDDEFLLGAGLCSAITALEQDASLAACIAQSLAFHPSADGSFCSYDRGYPHWKYSVMQDDVGERLRVAMSNYTAATCYAVLRTPVWCKSWGQLENWSSPYVGEMQQGITTYIWGKLKTVDEVYWMRSSENRPVTSKDFNRGLTFPDWWRYTRFEDERARFLSILSDEMGRATGIDAARARAIVLETVRVFLSHLDQLEAKNRQSLSPMQAVLALVRQGSVATLKRLLPVRWQESLKSARFGAAKVAVVGKFGTLSDIEQKAKPFEFAMNSQLLAELATMEKLIADFYRVRQEQTS